VNVGFLSRMRSRQRSSWGRARFPRGPSWRVFAACVAACGYSVLLFVHVWPIVRDDNRGNLAGSSHGIGPPDKKKLTVKQAVVIQVILVFVSTIIWWSLRP
jgi:hypothetical protein